MYVGDYMLKQIDHHSFILDVTLMITFCSVHNYQHFLFHAKPERHGWIHEINTLHIL